MRPDYVEGDPLRCLEAGSGECRGAVERWWNGDPEGKTWPRCEKHQRAREARKANSMEQYANCINPPSWFDPSYAGEQWNEDE